ncbi:MAG: GNAT family protein [Cyanobacteria bacterium J06598_3]
MFSGQIPFEPTDSTRGFCHQITQQASLRPLTTEDANELFALVDANRAYLRQWLPWLDMNQTADDSLNFIKSSLERQQANNGFVSALCYDSRHGSRIAGLVGLNYIDWDNRLSGIGYWLSENQQGKGLITQACRAVIDHGFEQLALNRIDIRCATQNFPSQAVAKRLGLIYEGTLRDAEWLYDHFVDHRVYSVIRREWPLMRASAASAGPAESSSPPAQYPVPNPPG